jgi:hypothetical protein
MSNQYVSGCLMQSPKCGREVDVQCRYVLQGSAELSCLAVARILHGLPSAAFPAAQWKGCGCWGRYADVDLGEVLSIAEEELKAFHSKS